jgi:hypothetical protein
VIGRSESQKQNLTLITRMGRGLRTRDKAL